MKILQVTQGYFPAIGGTEWLVQRVSEELVAQFGDELTVFTTNCYNGEGFWNPRMPKMEVETTQINGVTVRRFPVLTRVSQALRPVQKLFFSFGLPYHDWMRTYFGGPITPGLRGAIARQPANLVSAASFPLLHMFEAVQGARLGKKPVVLNGCLHPQDIWGFQRENIYSAIRAADHYIALTGFEAQYLHQRGTPLEKMSVIGVGVDPDRFSRITQAEARARLGLSPTEPVVGFVGQIGQHKGIDTLVKAMPAVWKARPDVRLLIAGSRAMFAQVLDQIVSNWPPKYRDQTTLIFNFKEEDKPYLFNAVDIFAYPSGFESFGISYLEAWASRKPVIGTWSGAIPYVVDSGKDGLLVPFHNCKLLTEAIMVLLKSPRWAQAMGEAGYSKVLSTYTWPTIARKFRDAYQQTIDSFTRGTAARG
ncbi:MAG: glycosyltransferase family 4 protein [Anaerolineaceae bacterium]|nr:glycosyltransferase family 4 protein [Anaerolineaceae bacterium]